MRYADNHCQYVEKFIDGHQYYFFTGPCAITQKMYTVKVPAEELFNYRQGQYIQQALKSVSAEDREFLMTGYSPEGWKQVFYQDDPDDYIYDSVEECKESGDHLVTCDDDGYCNLCGHQ